MPYELLNKKFRIAQKNVDREVAQVQSSASQLENRLQRSATIGDVSRVLNGMVERLTIMKRKVITVLSGKNLFSVA